MQEKMRGDEVYVRKLLIVNVINKLRNKMSLAKQKFSGFNKKTEV